jgi:hypothetical protein
MQLLPILGQFLTELGLSAFPSRTFCTLEIIRIGKAYAVLSAEIPIS